MLNPSPKEWRIWISNSDRYLIRYKYKKDRPILLNCQLTTPYIFILNKLFSTTHRGLLPELMTDKLSSIQCFPLSNTRIIFSYLNYVKLWDYKFNRFFDLDGLAETILELSQILENKFLFLTINSRLGLYNLDKFEVERNRNIAKYQVPPIHFIYSKNLQIIICQYPTTLCILSYNKLEILREIKLEKQIKTPVLLLKHNNLIGFPSKRRENPSKELFLWDIPGFKQKTFILNPPVDSIIQFTSNSLITVEGGKFCTIITLLQMIQEGTKRISEIWLNSREEDPKLVLLGMSNIHIIYFIDNFICLIDVYRKQIMPKYYVQDKEIKLFKL